MMKTLDELNQELVKAKRNRCGAEGLKHSAAKMNGELVREQRCPICGETAYADSNDMEAPYVCGACGWSSEDDCNDANV